MIELTRLNGKPMILNSDLIKTAEASPDTMLTLINGEKLIVREDLGEIVNRTLAYRAQLLSAIAQRCLFMRICSVQLRSPALRSPANSMKIQASALAALIVKSEGTTAAIHRAKRSIRWTKEVSAA